MWATFLPEGPRPLCVIIASFTITLGLPGCDFFTESDSIRVTVRVLDSETGNPVPTAKAVLRNTWRTGSFPKWITHSEVVAVETADSDGRIGFEYEPSDDRGRQYYLNVSSTDSFAVGEELETKYMFDGEPVHKGDRVKRDFELIPKAALQITFSRDGGLTEGDLLTLDYPDVDDEGNAEDYRSRRYYYGGSDYPHDFYSIVRGGGTHVVRWAVTRDGENQRVEEKYVDCPRFQVCFVEVAY